MKTLKNKKRYRSSRHYCKKWEKEEKDRMRKFREKDRRRE
jgi:hypothetical protein